MQSVDPGSYQGLDASFKAPGLSLEDMVVASRGSRAGPCVHPEVHMRHRLGLTALSSVISPCTGPVAHMPSLSTLAWSSAREQAASAVTVCVLPLHASCPQPCSQPLVLLTNERAFDTTQGSGSFNVRPGAPDQQATGLASSFVATPKRASSSSGFLNKTRREISCNDEGVTVPGPAPQLSRVSVHCGPRLSKARS